MPIRKTIFFNDVTWSHLKIMAASDLRSTSNFVQFLVEQEWDIRKHGNDAAVSIPGKNLALPKTATDM